MPQRRAHTFAAAGTFNVYTQIYDTSSNAWTDLDSAQLHVIGALPANAPTAKNDINKPAVAKVFFIWWSPSVKRYLNQSTDATVLRM